MSQPQLNLRLKAGFGSSPSTDLSSVTWTDITGYLRLQDGISLSRGRQDETQYVGAGLASLSLDNRAGNFTPGNTSGAFTPNVKLRTPLRLERCRYDAETVLDDAVFWIDAQFASASQTVPNLGTGGTVLDARLGSTVASDSNDPTFLAYDGTPYVYLPGVSGNYLSTPDAAALDITGDIDIRVRVALDDWTPAAIQTLAAKYQSGTGLLSYLLDVNTTGTLRLLASSDGTAVATNSSSTVATGIADGSVKWVRATLDVDNGAGGRDVKFWLSDDGATWTQLGATVTTAGTTSIFNSTSILAVGTRSDGASNPAAGKFYRAIVKNGIDGTTVLDIDTSVLTSGAATSFTATTGQTVTINRSATADVRRSVAVVAPCWLLGTDDYLSVPDNDLLDFAASDPFTVLAVVRTWATAPGERPFVTKRAGFSTASVGYNMTAFSDGRWYADMSDGTTRRLASNAQPTLGSLAMSTMVRDVSADVLRAYANTTTASTSDTTTGTLANSNDLLIGRMSGGTAYYGGFELVAVAVFRRALTAAEISAISTYYAGRTYDSRYTAPFMPVWTGYVESWGEGWNSGVQPVARVRAADRWARLNARIMRTLGIEEQLYDDPVLFYPLNDSEDATAAGDQSATPKATMPVTQAGSGGTATFGTASTMGADPDQTCLVLTRSDASNGKYLTQTYNPLAALAGVAGVTLECYVYLPVSVSGTVRAVELGRYASFDLLAIDLSTNAPTATVTIGSSTVTTSAGSAINDGGWHHLAATYDGTNLRLWVDGTNVQTSAAAFGTFTGSILTVGAQSNGTTLANGWFMGVAAYASALSGTRIAAHADAVDGATGETSLARFNRIVRLAVGSWAVSSSTATPSATMCPQPFDGVSAATLLEQVSDAERAPVHISAAGLPVWQARSERSPSGTPMSITAAVADSGTVFERSNFGLVNTAVYSRPGGATITVADSTSVTDYDPASDRKTIYVDSDDQLTSAANAVVNARKSPQDRVGQVTVDLVTAQSTVDIDDLVALDVSDALRITSLPRGSVTQADVFVEGVNDAITPVSWRRTWPASPLRSGGQVWRLGDATYSILGSTTILG